MGKNRKVVVVTGASSGIGLSTAKYLAEKGLTVYGTSRSDKSDAELQKSGVNMLRMDVTDDNSVKNAIVNIIEKEGRIDVLFNNAGSGISGGLEETSIEEHKALFETNYFGMVRVVNEVLTHMRKNKDSLIINTSSIGGIIGLPYQGVYSSTKFAIEGYSEALSKEVKRFGVKVCMIEPGDFKTGFTASRTFNSTNENSPYNEDFLKAKSVFEHDELNGCNPVLIAELVHKIINTRNPKLRYPIGKFEQKFSSP
jgi:short-subunit dehydrogenase